MAFQGLYSWEVGGMPKEDVLELSWADGDSEKDAVDMETATFARVLIAGAIENQSLIDERIKENLKGWDFARLNKVTLSILRMSVYALLFQMTHPFHTVLL